VTVGAGYLAGHVATGGGTGERPWTEPYGDYCNYYRLAPLDQEIPDSLGGLTGFTAPMPYSGYQLGADTGSGCEASGDRWAEGLSGIEPSPDCADVANVCGMQHSVSFGEAPYYLPWYAPNAYFILTAVYEPAVFRYSGSNSDAWGYLCALLEDTSSGQRLEYCLNEWSTWGAPPDEVTAFFDPFTGRGFAGVQTNFDRATRFATEEPESHDTIAGPGAVGQAYTYSAAITRGDLASAVTAINARIEGANGDTCPTGQTCYSTDPGRYKLIGLENGQEMWGDATYLGGNESHLSAATVAPGIREAAERILNRDTRAQMPCRGLEVTALSKRDARRLTSALVARAARGRPNGPLGPTTVTGPAARIAVLAHDPRALIRCAQAA